MTMFRGHRDSLKIKDLSSVGEYLIWELRE